MINYFEKENFARAVFTIEEGEIIEHTLGELCHEYAEETTSSRGVEPKFHTRISDNRYELWSWGYQGMHPKKIESFDSAKQAEHALLLSFKYDLYNGANNPIIFNTYEEAEKTLNQWLDEN